VPLLLAPLVSIAFGIVLAWVSREELLRHRGAYSASRAFFVVLLFAGLVELPVYAYAAVFHGDWAYLYLAPWGKVPSAVDALWVVGCAGLTPAGFAFGARPAVAGRFDVLSRALMVLGALFFGAFLLGWRRLSVSGTYAQFHGGFGAKGVAESALGVGLLLSWLALGAGLAWAVRSVRAASDA
jgi:hypothetical protein